MTHDERDEGASTGFALADFLSDTMRNRPEALLLMAAGAALMMTRGHGFGLADLASGAGSRSSAMGSRGRRRQAARGPASGIGERLHSAADTAAHLASDMRERVGDQVDDLRETAGDYAGRVARRAQDAREAVAQRSGEVIERARSGLQENIDYMLHEQPLALGALSLLAGVAIGAALPRTGIETSATGAAAGRMIDAARRSAQGPIEALKSAAGEAGEKLKEAVVDGPLDAARQRDPSSRDPAKSP